MSTAKHLPRHRRARRPMAPIGSLAEMMSQANLTPSRGTAVVTVTGLALTAVVTAANAAPIAQSDASLPSKTASVSNLPTTVTVPDIAWSAADELTATAEAPVAEEPVVEEVAETTPAAASRSEVRQSYVDPAVYAAANASGSTIVSVAMGLLGIPYAYGGSSPAGFDCSGFTQYVYAQVGISLPRTSGAQGAVGTFIPASEAMPGDLVWHAYGHVGIYAGNGMVVEATVPGEVTQIQPLWGDYSFVRIGG